MANQHPRKVISDRIWKQLEGAIKQAKHSQAGAPAGLSEQDFLFTDPKAEDVGKWEHKKATLQSAIEQRLQKIETLKSERKAAGKHVAVKDLPEHDRFSELRSEKMADWNFRSIYNGRRMPQLWRCYYV
jgi:hypothetical protein